MYPIYLMQRKLNYQIPVFSLRLMVNLKYGNLNYTSLGWNIELKK